MRFPLTPKSSTLDDLEQPIRTQLQKRKVFWSPLQKKLNEDKPIASSSIVSGNMRRMRIFRRVPLGASWCMTDPCMALVQLLTPCFSATMIYRVWQKKVIPCRILQIF